MPAMPDSPPQPLGRRILRPETLLSFAFAAAILFFTFRRLDIDPAAVWANIVRANPWWLLGAFVVWYGSVACRAWRWKWMLGNAGIDDAHGYRMPGVAGMTEIVLLAWFANCVVPAKLGDAYRCWLLKQDSGASFSAGLGSLIAERLTDLFTLCITLTAIGLLVFHGHLPSEAATTFQLGGVLIGVGAVALLVMWFTRESLQRRLPARVQDQYGRLHGAVFGSLRHPALLVAMSAALWISEGLRFWLVSQALDARMAFTAALFVALMGSLLTALPVTPAGLGVVEAGTSAVMIGVLGMNPDVAVAVILLDRVVAYWSVIAVGIALYLHRFGREARRAAAVTA